MKRQGRLRRRLLLFGLSLIGVSLVGTFLSLYQAQAVKLTLDGMNRSLFPFAKVLTQLQSDGQLYRQELERGLAFKNWNDMGWKPRMPAPWILDVLQSELEQVKHQEHPEGEASWKKWNAEIERTFSDLRNVSEQLVQKLEKSDRDGAAKIYPLWLKLSEDWTRELKWGTEEYDRSVRRSFEQTQNQVSELRRGLEMILVLVLSFSLLLLWFGERALRPLKHLAELARSITERGLRKEDKVAMLDIPSTSNDEIGQLTQEFHRMATSLLEREKTIESQTRRLKEQNRKLEEMGELNRNVLDSMRSAILVTDLEGIIQQVNPVAVRYLAVEDPDAIGTRYDEWGLVSIFPQAKSWLTQLKSSGESIRLDEVKANGCTFGGRVLPLRGEDDQLCGMVIFIDDLTEELALQDRLKNAEKLAAIGRLTAQVAHEIRNPLHSMGLEAEMASEVAEKIKNPDLKQGLASIQAGIERLGKITENYLKLSRLSSGVKTRVDLCESIENVLATYATLLQAQRIRVDWKLPHGRVLELQADRELLEQALGNLIKNSVQAMEDAQGPRELMVSCDELPSQIARLRISDTGPGISDAVRDQIFQPFITSKAQGTGLGLSFVRNVIEDHGGTITYDTEGEGASFEIRLPLTRVERTEHVEDSLSR